MKNVGTPSKPREKRFKVSEDETALLLDRRRVPNRFNGSTPYVMPNDSNNRSTTNSQIPPFTDITNGQSYRNSSYIPTSFSATQIFGQSNCVKVGSSSTSSFNKRSADNRANYLKQDSRSLNYKSMLIDLNKEYIHDNVLIQDPHTHSDHQFESNAQPDTSRGSLSRINQNTSMFDLNEEYIHDVQSDFDQSHLHDQSNTSRMDEPKSNDQSKVLDLNMVYDHSVDSEILLNGAQGMDGMTNNTLSTNETVINMKKDYSDLGDPIHKCTYCGAFFWYNERSRKDYKPRNPTYSLCCFSGKIQLPTLIDPPQLINDLLYKDNATSKHFQQNIRSYNSMFGFTSMGGKIDWTVNSGGGPPVFRISGQNYHMMGSLLPMEGSSPKFAQLYIFDTHNEIQNRIMAVRDPSDTDSIHQNIVADLLSMLNENNILVKSFRMARDKIQHEGHSNVQLRLVGTRSRDARTYNLPSISEVAALIVGDFDESLGERDLLVEARSGELHRISELHPSYLALQYPLMFPYGEDGYVRDIPFSNNRNIASAARSSISAREFFTYRFHERNSESSHILHSRRLFQQFVVDAYTMIETARLNYIRFNQTKLRCNMYKGLSDALLRGEHDPTTQGKRIILPSSFTGGARYMIQNYQDAMAICKWAGYPDLFITFTCNPKWPEIDRFLKERNLNPEDRPDVVCRVFNMKLDELMRDLRHNAVFGNVRAAIYTIEFQKRGLPHAHILLFLSPDSKYPTGKDIDNIISAEIPEETEDPQYYKAVSDFMLHGPCGAARNTSPCMDNDRCTKNFPRKYVVETTVDREGYPIYKRRDNGRTIEKSGVSLDNRYVVPHNKFLLLKYAAHLNVEWCNQTRSIKYLFKYINKGNDRVTAQFCTTAKDDTKDEINMYYDCRYISPCEAAWRTFGFDINFRDPSVERLSFHLPDQQTVYYKDTDTLQDVVNRPTIRHSMFLGWFEANKLYAEAKNLTYIEFPTRFVWKRDKRVWVPRRQGFSIGRCFYVPPGSGELYYLRLLINVIRGAESYEDMRRVNSVLYESFRDACFALGLLDDDKEFSDGIIEASHWGTGESLRRLFVNLLTGKSLHRPLTVWNRCWSYLSEDILYKRRKISGNQDLHLSDEELQNWTLAEVESILQKSGNTLRTFPDIPFPGEQYFHEIGNRLIIDELNYNREELAFEHASCVEKLTNEQRHVYDVIVERAMSDTSGVFFVYGYGGTGKTFVWRTLSAAIRSKGHIVLNVASSGIASLLLPGGRTAHSRFAIPLIPNENSTCGIEQGTPLAELIVSARLIIWDEAPMMHKYCFEALDRTLKDIMRFKNRLAGYQPFGGKTIVFGGDFRQILPVIPKGKRQNIVNATINSSYIWRDVQVLRLTKNMRLQNMSSEVEASELKEFSDWIAAIGDGVLGGDNDGEAVVKIPDDIILGYAGDPVEAIVNSTFPTTSSGEIDLSCIQDRAILAPTLESVDLVNQYMISKNKSESRVYLSSDSTSKSDGLMNELNDVHTPEFLNGLKCPGVPNHEIMLKVGTPVMLLRNIDHYAGLCNGTRLIITRLGNHVLEARILSGHNSGELVFIPRMTLTPSDTRLPFKFQRKQFPIIVSYAMTINKSQGQSLSRVGVFLKKPVFTHGQLYVAVSRVTSRTGLKILLCDKDASTSSTTNVVYKEVFQNL